MLVEHMLGAKHQFGAGIIFKQYNKNNKFIDYARRIKKVDD